LNGKPTKIGAAREKRDLYGGLDMKIITEAAKVDAAGHPPKVIEEFIGRVNSHDADISIARMKSPQGWSEPGQTPQFDEYTLVLKGKLSYQACPRLRSGVGE